MLATGVDLKFGELCPAHAIARQHATNRLADDLFWASFEHLRQRSTAQSARVSRVPVIALLLELVAGDCNLARVDHDYVIAGVDMRCKLWLGLAPQRVRYTGCKPAQRQICSVDDE